TAKEKQKAGPPLLGGPAPQDSEKASSAANVLKGLTPSPYAPQIAGSAHIEAFAAADLLSGAVEHPADHGQHDPNQQNVHGCSLGVLIRLPAREGLLAWLSSS